LYAPHIGCTTVDEIRHVLSIFEANPFIRRFYTFEVLLQMYQTFLRLGLPVADLGLMFDDPSKANQTNIQKFAFSMLEQLIVSNSNDIIKQVCLVKKIYDEGVNLATIFTSDIGRFCWCLAVILLLRHIKFISKILITFSRSII
jgi:hypothetical protein